MPVKPTLPTEWRVVPFVKISCEANESVMRLGTLFPGLQLWIIEMQGGGVLLF